MSKFQLKIHHLNVTQEDKISFIYNLDRDGLGNLINEWELLMLVWTWLETQKKRRKKKGGKEIGNVTMKI